jgi:hypothetical protein
MPSYPGAVGLLGNNVQVKISTFPSVRNNDEKTTSTSNSILSDRLTNQLILSSDRRLSPKRPMHPWSLAWKQHPPSSAWTLTSRSTVWTSALRLLVAQSKCCDLGSQAWLSCCNVYRPPGGSCYLLFDLLVVTLTSCSSPMAWGRGGNTAEKNDVHALYFG